MEGLESLNLNFIGFTNRRPGICQLKAKTIHPLKRGEVIYPMDKKWFRDKNKKV